MSQIVVRTDPETERALEHLVELTGRGRSEAVREAIRAAEREAVLARVERQAEAIRNDPADRAEMLAILADMESADDAW
ncbi:ribbon-helix-helix protein, CopG family [Xylanimonas allomyrinae]|uniref:Ribbon-helix-helix protein, CopG family n=1 Tax=Xylanimonas allomyrinae TaxID=2509459 RepID=A0A4P6ER02_9MICO|nr:ribbon-helix-helix protein, CopG family [Xylanimonas allomyrinae]QAY64303.1 ribbon-helix-helix protein, CopG family [Xylanimonas allomyrinae]